MLKQINVTETLTFLEEEKNKYPNIKKNENGYPVNEENIIFRKHRFLILIKEDHSFIKTTKQYAKVLGVSRHSVDNWAKRYTLGGYHNLMSINNKKNARSIMTDEMEEFIIHQIENSEEKVSYKKLLLLVNQKFKINMKYPTLYKFARKFSYQK
jgi:transposase